jgi:hypothetical protein
MPARAAQCHGAPRERIYLVVGRELASPSNEKEMGDLRRCSL